MKKNKILIIFLIILIILMISLVVFKNIIYKDDVDNNNMDNKIQDINISNILLSDIDYVYDGKNTNFNFSVTNNNKNSVRINTYVVSIYDEKDNLINIFSFNNSVILETDNGYYMGFTIDMKYMDSYKLKIEFPELEVIK